MGGLWVDVDQMTNIPGIFAAGECEYQYHGANRLGGNGMLSAIYGGMVAGPSAVQYMKGLTRGSDSVPPAVFASEVRRQQESEADILRMDGGENAYQLHEELGQWMTQNVTVVRHNDRLEKTLDKISELRERYHRINIQDTSRWSNQSVSFTRQLWGMLELARVITLGALLRNESRGAHFKPEYPERDDANWLKTTIATHTPDGPVISYEPVELQYLRPRVRKYDVDKEATKGA